MIDVCVAVNTNLNLKLIQEQDYRIFSKKIMWCQLSKAEQIGSQIFNHFAMIAMVVDLKEDIPTILEKHHIHFVFDLLLTSLCHVSNLSS